MLAYTNNWGKVLCSIEVNVEKRSTEKYLVTNIQ